MKTTEEEKKADRSAFSHEIATQKNFAQILHNTKECVAQTLKYQYFSVNGYYPLGAASENPCDAGVFSLSPAISATAQPDRAFVEMAERSCHGECVS